MRFPRRLPLQKLAEGCPVACRRGMLHPAVSSLSRGKGVQMSRREIGSSLDMISADEAARILKVSSRTVRRLCMDRKIPAVKVGSQWRIDRTELMRTLARDSRMSCWLGMDGK